MALIRGFVKVGPDGTVKLPSHILRQVGWRETQLVELKVLGCPQAYFVILRGRTHVR